MKDSMLFIIVIVLAGCSSSKNVIGHWHINRLNERTGQYEEPYLAMDVINDTLAYIGTSSIYVEKWNLDTKSISDKKTSPAFDKEGDVFIKRNAWYRYRNNVTLPELNLFT